MKINLGFDYFTALQSAAIPYFLLHVLIHVLFAVAVFRDASKLHLSQPYRGTVLVGPATWALGTLLGGIYAAAIYWVVNRSSLRPPAPPAD